MKNQYFIFLISKGDLRLYDKKANKIKKAEEVYSITRKR